MAPVGRRKPQLTTMSVPCTRASFKNVSTPVELTMGGNICSIVILLSTKNCSHPTSVDIATTLVSVAGLLESPMSATSPKIVARNPFLSEIASSSLQVEQLPRLPVARANVSIASAPSSSSVHARWYSSCPGGGSNKISKPLLTHRPTSTRQWTECRSGLRRVLTEGLSRSVPRSMQNLSMMKPSAQIRLPISRARLLAKRPAADAMARGMG
mmetsp:Transcript_2865/g.4393  ORF Transcript_2865/g.4393 Transcript_2865/m.4393 type:complete len:212 (-) Transcript_2865:7-642(-)